MKLMSCVLVALSLVAQALWPVQAAEPAPFEVAITVDDLPAHGSPTPGMSRTEIATSLLATLKGHGVPEAWGFVNAVRVKQEPDSEAGLKLWREAGYPLGNHTYSHVNIREAGLDGFIADLKAGEPLVAKYMRGQNWHMLRFPYLSAGSGKQHDGVMAWLNAHQYGIADVSMSFSDWAYTEPYNRCLAKGNKAAIAAMKKQYLNAVRVEIIRTKMLSRRLFGRQIPLVLLTHEGGFSAVMLSKVLDIMEQQGARYITLEQAESDPAYSESTDNAADGELLGRMAAMKGTGFEKGLPAPVAISNLQGLCQ